MYKQKKNMPMRNNLTIRNILPVSKSMICLLMDLSFLRLHRKENGIFGDFVDRASQAPLDGVLD